MVIPEHQLFQLLPCRLGQNNALDDAVKCICTTNTNGDSKPYVKALHSLQDALNDANRSVTSETLAAATLLQMFEQYVDSADTAWLIHANGVIRMLELRGPNRIQDAVELTTLQVQVGNIFGKAVRDRRPCFLAEPGWKALLLAGRSNPNDTSTVSKALANMLEIGVYMPGLLCQYEDIARDTHVGDPTDFIRSLHDMRRNLQEWLEIYHLDAQLNGTKIDINPQSTERIKLASRHSVIVFLIMTNYMLLVVQTPRLNLDEVDNKLNYSPASQLVEIISQNKPLASLAKSTWIQLKRADAIAAANTNNLMRTMLLRVLELRSYGGAEMNLARSVIEELHTYLAGDLPDLSQLQAT